MGVEDNGGSRYEAEAVDPCWYMTSFPNLMIISNIYMRHLGLYLSVFLCIDLRVST